MLSLPKSKYNVNKVDVMLPIPTGNTGRAHNTICTTSMHPDIVVHSKDKLNTDVVKYSMLSNQNHQDKKLIPADESRYNLNPALFQGHWETRKKRQSGCEKKLKSGTKTLSQF